MNSKGLAHVATKRVTKGHREISEDWSFQTGLKDKQTRNNNNKKNHHHRKTDQIQRIQNQITLFLWRATLEA